MCSVFIASEAMSSTKLLMAVGRNIRTYRKQRGWTILELSTRAGLDSGYLSKLEREIIGYSRDTVECVAQALGVPLAELFTEASNVDMSTIGTRRIPVIDNIQAGSWTGVNEHRSESDFCEYLLTSEDVSNKAFAMYIKGDSMVPRFQEGDRIVVDPDVAPYPGCFVVAANGDGEATFKQYREVCINEHGNTIFELVPLNTFYPTIRSDSKQIRIIGTAVEHRQSLRRGSAHRNH